MYVDLLNDVSKIEYTCDSDQMSLRENNLLDSKIPSTTYMGARGVGFGNVAARFGERFSSNIRLNSRVIRISQYQEDGGGEAVVKYVHEGKHLTVAARAVVVTASLGVLKRGSIKFDLDWPKTLPATTTPKIAHLALSTDPTAVTSATNHSIFTK